MTALSASLLRNERLKNRGHIKYLFSDANEKVGKYPLLLLYAFAPKKGDGGVQVLFSVSKKKFPRAVDRNRLKRLMREAYRHQLFTNLQTQSVDEQLLLAFVYTGKSFENQEIVNLALANIYDVLTQRITESH
jgi:ribonuclease P protein component